MTIAYSSKINERLIGQSISNESHIVGIIGVAVVSPRLIRLIEIPQAPAPLSTVSITGSGGPYNEITSGTPTGGQFLVDYTTGVITFDIAQDGNTVLVSYIGLGSEIAAEDVNELQEPVGIALNLNGSLSNNIVKPASISNTGTDDFTFPRDVFVTRNLTTLEVTSVSSNAASSGTIRLANSTDSVSWRNAGNSADLPLTVNASNQLTFNGTPIELGTLTSAHIFVGNVSNVATDVPMSGDINISNTGSTTIQPAVVTGSKIASATITNTNLTIGTFSAITGIGLQSQALDMNTHFIHNVVDPTLAQDAATKNYVDTHPTTPGGTNGAVQFNNSGVFGGNAANFFWDSTHNQLNLNGTPSFLTSAALNAFHQISLISSGSPNSCIIDMFNNTGSVEGLSLAYNFTTDVASFGSHGDMEFQYGSFATIVYLKGSTTNIGVNNSTPDASALLDLTSTTQGFLPPRMTDPTTDIASPAEGLIAYDTTSHQWLGFNGTAWVVLG